jgi:hypothetical protein
MVLRATASWALTLFAGVLLGIVISGLMPLLLPEIVAELVRVSKDVLAEMAAQITAETGRQLDDWLHSMFAGILGSVHLFVMVASLVLARALFGSARL